MEAVILFSWLQFFSVQYMCNFGSKFLYGMSREKVTLSLGIFEKSGLKIYDIIFLLIFEK